jgi:hypothetical protein
MTAYARRWKAGVARLWLKGTLANLRGTERIVENMLWIDFEVEYCDINVRPWSLTYAVEGSLVLGRPGMQFAVPVRRVVKMTVH